MKTRLVSRLLSLVLWGVAFTFALMILGISLLQASAESKNEGFFEGTGSAIGEATVTAKEGLFLATVSGEPGNAEGDQNSVVVAYALPHPGLLPGHPLYWLKMVRDQIRLFFTHRPSQRAGLLLHYADKRLAAAGVLATEGKLGLAAETATKAEMYLLRCQELMGECEESPDLVAVRGEFNWSVEKHRSVLAQLTEKLGSNQSLLEPAQQVFTQVEQVRCQ